MATQIIPNANRSFDVSGNSISWARLPLTSEVAELIGDFADEVQNRSLLLDKFAFHKHWSFGGEKRDEASRLSLLRLCDNGRQQLAREADKFAGEAEKARRKGRFDKVEEMKEAEKLPRRLSQVKGDNPEDLAIRAKHTSRFLRLFTIAYGNDKASIIIGQLEGRLAINLADSLIQNAGICLDRLFGLPYIPGSAVKGVCRHAALEELKAAKGHRQKELFELFHAIFGTSDNDFTDGVLRPFKHLLANRSENQKGAIAFLPAYPVNEARVVVDLTNVHYPDYYRTGRMEELSNERLRPNPFPAVETGAQFAFCLVLNGINNDKSLLDQATRWLETALTIRGLGAKTAAGYGWFSLHPEILQHILDEERREAETLAAIATAEAEAKIKADAEAQRRASLNPEERAFETLPLLPEEAFAIFARNLASKSEHEQRAFLRLLRDHKDKRERWKIWKKKKADLAATIESVRQKLSAPALP